jgi:malate synthase
MRAYAELLVRTCHRRGAHAIGGTAAFIPSRKDPEVNRVALAKVREDKEREAQISRSQVWQWVRTGHFTVEQVRVEAALIEAGDEA